MPDVQIVGSGPAGTAAGIVCAEAGLRVRLIRLRPGDSWHFESVLPGCEPLLRRLGVLDALRAGGMSAFNAIAVNGQRQELGRDPDGTAWVGYHVRRDRFDRVLLARAIAAGVEVVDGAAERAAPDGKNPEWLIDATGRHKWLGRKLRLDRMRWSRRLTAWRGLVQLAAGDRTAADAPSFQTEPSGWWWLAAVGSRQLMWTRVGAGRAPPTLPVRGEQLTAPSAANVTWEAFRPAARAKWFLVGDAAGTLDPASGSGILLALSSGVAAAHAVVAACRQPRLQNVFVADYAQWHYETLRQKARGLATHYRRLGLADFVLKAKPAATT